MFAFYEFNQNPLEAQAEEEDSSSEFTTTDSQLLRWYYFLVLGLCLSLALFFPYSSLYIYWVFQFEYF